ncbi:C40 family peptidase [Streptosporangium sp. NPDC006007]|uniref:C40 family peptidase n=1 Tax=Streptosporangium sp. NPDC006007 TaxID=3154575 RepID=UPI00339F185F
MITTLITVTVLTAALAGVHQASATHPCPTVATHWIRLLSGAGLPDGVRRRLEDNIHIAPTTGRETNQVGKAGGSPENTENDKANKADKAGGIGEVGESGEEGKIGGSDETGKTGEVEEKGENGEAGEIDEAGRAPSGRRPETVPAAASGTPRHPLGRAFSGIPNPGHVRGGPCGDTSDGDHARPVGAATSSEPSSLENRGNRENEGVAGATDKVVRLSVTSLRRSRRLFPGQLAAAAALRQVGRPYVWGGGSGTGPTGGGFDCSGLALHAWSKAGARLPHYTGSQFRQGLRVPFSRLRPGDLVFFGGGAGDPTHVGVYLKNGIMVHAPKTGDVVRATRFTTSAYYRAHYRGAVRPES